MTAMTNQLLKLARADQSPLPARRQLYELNGIVTEVLAEAVPFAESRGVDIGLTGSAGAILCDRDDIRHLIGNLVDNAVRYTRRGGRVDIRLAAGNGTATVSVIDEGPGIPEEDLPRVFDRFFRSHSAPDGGAGLGLSIAKIIADKHEASLRLRNRSPEPGLIAEAMFQARTPGAVGYPATRDGRRAALRGYSAAPG